MSDKHTNRAVIVAALIGAAAVLAAAVIPLTLQETPEVIDPPDPIVTELPSSEYNVILTGTESSEKGDWTYGKKPGLTVNARLTIDQHAVWLEIEAELFESTDGRNPTGNSGRTQTARYKVTERPGFTPAFRAVEKLVRLQSLTHRVTWSPPINTSPVRITDLPNHGVNSAWWSRLDVGRAPWHPDSSPGNYLLEHEHHDGGGGGRDFTVTLTLTTDPKLFAIEWMPID